VRLGRRRFWKGDYGSDKVAAYQTLHECLLVVAKLVAPVAPFFAERLYRDLNQVTGRDKEDSVHLTPFPGSRTEWIDRELENRIETAQKIASLVFSIRQKEKIKVRQPLQRMLIPVLNEDRRRQIESVQHLILPEVNVKELEFMDDTSGILVKSIKPNFKVLGPKYGRDMKEIGLQVAGFDQQDIIEIEQKGEIEIELENKSVKLLLTDVEITSQDVDGWNVANSADITVALDTTVTEDLKKEGIARELVNRIQNLRKESGYNVTDRIVLKFQKDPWLNRAVQSNTDYIKQETLADELSLEDALGDGVEISFDEVTTKMWIEKV
jgi:isoleucyl-tRNA synthetase